MECHFFVHLCLFTSLVFLLSSNSSPFFAFQPFSCFYSLSHLFSASEYRGFAQHLCAALNKRHLKACGCHSLQHSELCDSGISVPNQLVILWSRNDIRNARSSVPSFVLAARGAKWLPRALPASLRVMNS